MAKYSTQKDEEEKKKAQKVEQEKVRLAPSVTADVLKYAQELSGATKKNPASHTPDINPNKNTNIKKTADGDDVFVAPGMENLGPRAAKYVQNVALAGDEKAQKVFANQYGAISASMNTFKGFTDVNGNAVNMNTADLNSIIRSIRAEPNQKRRTAYAEALEKLTKTPGSRFFGAAFDKNNAKTFLNSAALSQNEYDKIVKKYESVFNPQAGHEEENVAAYAEAMEEIEAGVYDAYVKKARIDALNDAYRSQLATDTIPDLTSYTSPQEPQNAPEAAENPVAEQEPMPKGGAVWNTNGEAYTIVDGKAVKVTPDAAPEPIAPSAPSLQEALKDEKFKERYLERLLEKEGKEAADFTKETLDSMVQKGVDSGDFARFVVDQAMASSVQVASASPVRGVFKGKEKKETFGPERPTIQQENEHSLSQALRDEAFYGEYMSAVKAKNEIPYGSIDLSHDPIKAASYVAAGEVRQLTKETQDALAEIASESPGWRAVMGVTIDPTQDQLQAAQDGDTHARAFVDATRDYWATGDTNAILGSTLTSYLNLSKSDRFPPPLRDDMQGAIAELAYRAEQAYKNGEFNYDPARETLYDAYTKLNPASMQLVRGVKKQVHDMYLERKQAEKLAYGEEVKNEQELLKEHREQVASGNYTQEAYDHVLMEAPQVTTQSARTDATYNAMFQEIAMDRTLSDGMEDSWYNQMAEVYLRENGLPDDLFSVAAMQYKDTLAAFEKDLLLSDMRVAATLDYADLGSMYEKWGGMDVDKLHERAEIALKQMAANVTDEDIAVLSQQNLYTGTGEEVGNAEAFGIGTAHGVLDTSGEMLEGIWAFSSMSKEDSVAAVYKVRQDWSKRYGVAFGTDMYKHAMYEYCDLIPEEHGKAIREYLDAGYDPFRLGIDPTNESIILETSKKLDGRAKAIQKWAFGALDAKQGKVFEVGSATGSTLTMQTVATVTQLGTGNPLIGSLVGYGLVSGNRQIKEELANDATRKEAKTMGYLRAWSDSVANMLSSDKFTEKLRGFVGFGPLVAKGLDAAGDIASARGSLGMIKRYGNIVGKAIKGAGEQILEETVVDPMLEGTTWQIAEAGGRAYLGGAGFIQSVFKGLANIDVMESVEGTVKDAGMNFISTLPLAIIGGLGDGFKASRAAATKLMATGDADAAQEFVEAVVSDLEVPENRDTLNAALHDAAVGEEAAVIAMTDDENGGTDIDIGAKAQEQADAHAKSEENSMAAAEAGRVATLAAQERINAGEINPELVTQIGNGVAAHTKNSQSVLEHRREKNQKQAEADVAFAEGMKKATAKAEAEVSAREAAAQNIDPESAIQIEAKHTQEQRQEIRDYQNAVNNEMLQVAQMYRDDPGAKNTRVILSEASEREAKDIEQLTGVNVEGYTHAADRNFFTHVEKDHGENGITDRSMKSLKDVSRVEWVIQNYDNVELLQKNGEVVRSRAYMDKNDEPSVQIRYTKKLNGSVYVVEAVGENKWKRLWLVSAYVQKNNPAKNSQGNSVTQAPNAKPSANVQNVLTSPDISSVKQGSKEVKREGVQAAIIPEGNVEQSRYGSMDAGRIEPTPTTGRAKRNVVRTYKRLAKSLGVGQAFGTRKMNDLPDPVAGYYETHANYVASRTNYGSNIEVDAHELGHAIAHRLGITGTDDMVRNLTTRFTANYPANQLPGEAFAEFFWRYMLNDDDARRFAGDAFVADFERRMRRDGILRDVKKAQRDTRRFMLAEANDRIGLMVRDKSDKSKDDTITETFEELERSFISRMVDSTRPAEDVNAAVRKASGGSIQERMNLRNAALMQSTAPRRAWHILMENLTDVNGTIVGKGLRQRLEEAGIRGNQFETLIEYMLAKHSLDRDVQSKPVFDRAAISTQDTRDFIERIERDNPEIVAAERAFQKFRHDFMMEYMVNTGFMSAEDLEFFEIIYPHYVPTYRVKDRGRRGVGGQTYEIRRASGSTEEIINPMDSFVDMVNTIVAMNLRNETAKTWDRVYMAYEGMGIFGRRVTEDQETRIMDMRSVQERVRKMLEDSKADSDVIQNVLNAIGEEQIRRSGTDDVNMPNILTVQLPDGSKHFYEMFDTELFEMFAGTQDSGKSALSILGVLTRSMSMLTTGSNPLFFMRNAMRDFQNSVNYGSWASNYLSGGARWLRAAWDVWRESGEYDQYRALGGGGWTRAEAGSKKGAEAYRGELFKGYNTSNIGRGLKWAGRAIWDGITLNRLNEIVEQASRYAEYRYGQHDRSTAEGRQEAYLAAQESTTDFSRRGNSRIAAEARMLVPFFNASLQGIYRTGRQLTEAERDRAGTRFMKTIINTGIVSALASAWMLKSMDDEEKEEFFWLSDDLKAKHIYLPNFAPDVLGDVPLIRIPLPQDPLTYAVHGAVTNAMWTGEGEEWAVAFSAIADNVMDSVNPVGSTILDPLISMATNRNWYGSNIVPRRMEDWEPTTQYTEETPDAFVEASRILEAATGSAVSPMMLQYLAEQYTGFVGQIAIPLMTKDANAGKIGGIQSVIQKARNTLTSDPLKSNDVVSCVYDNEEFLTYITKAQKNGRPLNMLRNNLTDREAKRAANEAYDLTHKGGAVYDAKKIITECYDEIEEIEANQSLSADQKYELVSRVRREMIEAALDANEEMAEFRETYVTGESFLTRFMRAPILKGE